MDAIVSQVSCCTPFSDEQPVRLATRARANNFFIGGSRFCQGGESWSLYERRGGGGG